MTREELKEITRQETNRIHRKEYKGIRVFLSSDKFIEIKPLGDDNWYRYDTEDIENQVANIPSGGSLMGIPKFIWKEWLSESFDW